MSKEQFSPPRPGGAPGPDKAGGDARGLSTQEGEDLLAAIMAMIRDRQRRLTRRSLRARRRPKVPAGAASASP